MRLDAHQHFWRYNPEEYPWIPPGSPLQRDWLPEDLATVQAPHRFAGSIAVQARQTVAESDWLLGIADADPRIRGVVGWVDLRHPEVDRDLRRLARHPRFVGVRHVVQDESPDFMLGDEFLRGLRKLPGYGLTYDLLVYPEHLPSAAEVARRIPELRFVLDHIAKPRIRDRRLEPWATLIRELAQLRNVWCKVSGLVTEADLANWRPEDFRPYLDVVIEAFGPERLMFGSDWPVCLLASGYGRVVEVIEGYMAGMDPLTREAIFGGNAARFYLERRRNGAPPDAQFGIRAETEPAPADRPI